MHTKARVLGLLGLLVLATSAVAESPLAPTEKTYRLLQAISSQLEEAQTSFAPHDAAPAAALAKAQEQVRIAVAHCCHALYAAQLTAAKAALTQGKQQLALHHLRKADETLKKCPETPPAAEPQHEQEHSILGSASARRSHDSVLALP